MIIFNCTIFFLNFKSAKFAIFVTNCRNTLSSWIFLNTRFLCINALLFCRKQAKFVHAYREAIGRRERGEKIVRMGLRKEENFQRVNCFVFTQMSEWAGWRSENFWLMLSISQQNSAIRHIHGAISFIVHQISSH